MAGRDIYCTIPVKGGCKMLLNDASGYVRPGLMVLMGESGVGKTMLPNTLAQRIYFGEVTGNFLVDGMPLPKSFQRATGFAEQQDMHEPTATVREALIFSALLRQPAETPLDDKYDYIETIWNGLNQEQRKRLTIGVELASKPRLLMFLDKILTAFNVVRFLRKLTNSSQASLCTIHQPSTVLFEYFDDLILLKRGSTCGRRSLQGNPNRKEKDWAEVWLNSAGHANHVENINQPITARLSQTSENQIDDSREFAMPW
ncbi:hypothetical protein B9Z19DRAFT_1103193 [Tuber borchii]|uniref:ABC transporter domain-containing protein n=1 Tax=Tuber borchii TaxID=42251 RepID=A0A2T6ZHI2_TUBBO|nr:hypothetical protein B9Z19DRAFT_1103193 [Tuber borchii]